ncbi:MAG: D-alanyl-D-alanine dipeptidase [Bacteroidetes bacterium]|nr:D-alanyl-D-alanine dipeptidase [Bacteroidota bacterium]
MKILPVLLFLSLPLFACQSEQPKPPANPIAALPQETASIDTIAPPKPSPNPEASPQSETQQKDANAGYKSGSSAATGIAQGGFSDVAVLDPGIRLDIRYATANNFTKSKIYDCPRCLLRPEAAEALVKANKALKAKGYALKMFDCYRPRPYQQRLWDKVPDPDYVTPPTKGSMHSRGAAVDLTIVDMQGRELEMGTPYDFFGKEAHTDYKGLSARVQANRDLLRTTLEAVGFKGIRTEWWHFSYQKRSYPLSDYVWPCPDDK